MVGLRLIDYYKLQVSLDHRLKVVIIEKRRTRKIKDQR